MSFIYTLISFYIYAYISILSSISYIILVVLRIINLRFRKLMNNNNNSNRFHEIISLLYNNIINFSTL